MGFPYVGVNISMLDEICRPSIDELYKSKEAGEHLNYSKKPSFKEIKNQQYIRDVVFRLVLIDKNRNISVSGSCFSVGLDFLVTAKHVIEDFLEKISIEKYSDDMRLHVNLWAVQLLEGENPYAIWAVEKIWLVSNSDLALLKTVPYCENANNLSNPKRVSLNLFPPEIGSRIFGFGYHSADIRKTNNDHDILNIVIEDVGSATVGEVIEVCEYQRDKIRLNFPCFRVNARFDGGMSGGPVFNDDGQVCGVICSSLPADEVYSEHISYVTTLWPLMGMIIDADRSGDYTINSRYPVLDLARDDIIDAVGWEKVAIEIYKNDVSYISNIRKLGKIADE